MQSTAQMRVSVKPYLQEYVQQRADELGITDISEVVNLLILDHKRGLIPATTPAIQTQLTAMSPSFANPVIDPDLAELSEVSGLFE